MTERLYFTDPYLTTFAAHVAARSERNGHPAVALDRSAFYPEGGGQPADTGTLGAVSVLDVQTDDSGVVWHMLAGPLATDDVTGVIDWSRRFDHMQQHHGQHLLSAAFEDLFRAKTLAFHLGAEYASIDVSGDISDAQIVRAEDRTNAVIWEDRPVHARFVTREELIAIPLRKPPTVDGAVRVVSVEGFDHSACGGTHPRSTGAVGVLHIRRREKRGADTRVEFVCGGRAQRDMRKMRALLARLSASVTVGPDELEDAVRRIRERDDATRTRLTQVLEALLSHEARALVAGAEKVQGTPLVHAVRNDLSLDECRTLVRAVTGAGAIMVLGIASDKAQLLVARPASHTLDCSKLVREVLAEFGGRGGGQPAAAQGGVPDAARLGDAVHAAAERVRHAGS